MDMISLRQLQELLWEMLVNALWIQQIPLWDWHHYCTIHNLHKSVGAFTYHQQWAVCKLFSRGSLQFLQRRHWRHIITKDIHTIQVILAYSSFTFLYEAQYADTEVTKTISTFVPACPDVPQAIPSCFLCHCSPLCFMLLTSVKSSLLLLETTRTQNQKQTSTVYFLHTWPTTPYGPHSVIDHDHQG